MFMTMNLVPSLKVGHVSSTTGSLGQILEKLSSQSRGHSFDPVFMELFRTNIFMKSSAHMKNWVM